VCQEDFDNRGFWLSVYALNVIWSGSIESKLMEVLKGRYQISGPRSSAYSIRGRCKGRCLGIALTGVILNEPEDGVLRTTGQHGAG